MGELRNQLSLKQLSGSFGNARGKIRSDISKASASAATIALSGSNNKGDLAGLLSHMASAIKRINGGSDFATVGGGVLSGSTYEINASGDITFNADGGDIKFEDGSQAAMTIKMDSTAGDAAFLDAGDTEIFRIDGSANSLLMANNLKIELGHSDEYVYGDGTDIHFGVGSGGDINVPSSIGVTFGNDGEKIEGDGSGITVAGGTITLDSEGDINLNAGGADVVYQSDTREFLKITSGSGVVDVSLAGASSSADLVFKDYGGTEIFRVDSSADSLLMSSTKKIEFGSANAYIQHDGTDLKIADDADVNIVPSVDFLVDAGGSIILDAHDGDIALRDSGTNYLVLSQSGGSAILSSSVHSEDIQFHGNNAAEVFRVDGSANSLLMASGKELQFADDGEHISGDGSTLSIVSEAGSIAVGAALTDGQTLKLGKNSAVEVIIAPHGTAGSEKYSVTNTAGTAVDAILIDSTAGGVTLKSANTTHGVVIATATSGVPVSIGHTTSETTVNDNLNVTGDLEVDGSLLIKGSTTTVDTTNMHVEDPLMLLGSGSTSAGDRGIVLKTAAATGKVMFWDNSASTFTFGSTTTAGDLLGTSTTITTSSLDQVRVGKLSFEEGRSYLDTNADGNAVTMTAGSTFTVDAATDIVLDAAGGDIDFKVDGTAMLQFTSGSSVVEIQTGATYQDLVFKEDGGTEVFRMDASAESLLMASGKELQFADSGEHISGDGSTLSIVSEAGSIAAGAALADGQTLKLGKNGAVEVIIAPHGTPASEKYSVTNTAGTAVSDTAAAVQVTATVGAVTLASGVADAAAIRLKATNAAGGIDMDAGTGTIALDAGGISLDSAGVAANFTVASDGAGEDLTIEVTGATNSSVVIKSSGTSNDAISIATSAGGMDLTVAGAAAGEDLDISSNSSVNVTSTEDATDSIKFEGLGYSFNSGDLDDTYAFNDAPLTLASIGSADSMVSMTNKLGNMDRTKAAFDGLNWNGGKVITTKTRTKKTHRMAHAVSSGGTVTVSGSVHDLGEHEGNVDVFLNGQLILTGSSAVNGDYALSLTNTAVVKFYFALEKEDTVTVITG